MKIDFTKADAFFAESDRFYDIGTVLAFSALALFVGVLVAAATSKRFKAFAGRIWCVFFSAIAVVTLAGLIISFFAISSAGDYKKAVNEAVDQAAEETYGLELSDAEVAKLAESLLYTSYGEKGLPASGELTLYGSTKVEGKDGQIIDITLIARDGEYQIVGGEGVYVELPKVD